MKIKDQWTGGLLQPFALVSGQFEFYWLFLVERSDAGYKQRVTGTDDTKMALYGPRCAIKRKSKRRNPEGGGGSENGEREKKREKERKREKKREKERRIIRPSTRPLLPAFWLAISLGRFHKPQARGDGEVYRCCDLDKSLEHLPGIRRHPCIPPSIGMDDIKRGVWYQGWHQAGGDLGKPISIPNVPFCCILSPCGFDEGRRFSSIFRGNHTSLAVICHRRFLIGPPLRPHYFSVLLFLAMCWLCHSIQLD